MILSGSTTLSLPATFPLVKPPWTIYIMWLDADDLLLPEDGNRLVELKKNLEPHYNTVTMPYHLGLDSAGNPTHVLRRNRLVKRACQFKWIGAVHEYLEVYGPVYHSDVCVTHLKEKNIRTETCASTAPCKPKESPFLRAISTTLPMNFLTISCMKKHVIITSASWRPVWAGWKITFKPV